MAEEIITQQTETVDTPSPSTVTSTNVFEPIYRHKDGRVVTKSQLIKDGITEDRINAGITNGIITQIGDTEDPDQQFRHKDGRIVSVKELNADGITADRISNGITNGIIVPIEKKNQVPPQVTPSTTQAPTPKPDVSPSGASAGVSDSTTSTEIPQVSINKDANVPSAKPIAEKTKVPEIPMDQKDPITLVMEANNLLNAKKVMTNISPTTLGTIETLLPDDESIAKGKQIQDYLASQKINANDLYNKIKDIPSEIYDWHFTRQDGTVDYPYSKEKVFKMYTEEPLRFEEFANNSTNRVELQKAVSQLPEEERKIKGISPISVMNEYNDLNRYKDWNSYVNNNVERQKEIINTYIPNLEDRKKALDRLEKNVSLHYNYNNPSVQQEYNNSDLKDKLDISQYSALQVMKMFHPDEYKQAINFLNVNVAPEYQYKEPGLVLTKDGFSLRTSSERVETEDSIDKRLGKETLLKKLSDQGRYYTTIALQYENEQIAKKLKSFPADQSADYINKFNQNNDEIKKIQDENAGLKNDMDQLLRSDYKNQLINKYNDNISKLNGLVTENQKIASDIKAMPLDEKNSLIQKYNENLSKIDAIKTDYKEDDKRYPLTADLKYDMQVKDYMQQAGFNAAQYAVAKFGQGLVNTGKSLENTFVSLFGDKIDNVLNQMQRFGESKREQSDFYLPETYQTTNGLFTLKFDDNLRKQVDGVIKGRNISDLSSYDKDEIKNILLKNQDQIQTITNPAAGKNKNFLSLATLYANTGMIGDIASFAVQAGVLTAMGIPETMAAAIPMYTTSQNDFYKEAIAKGMSDPDGYANAHAFVMFVAGLISPTYKIAKRAIGLNTEAGKMMAGISEKTWNDVVNKNSALVTRISNSVSHVGKEAANMALTYGAGTSLASDIVNKELYNENITPTEMAQHAAESTKHLLLSSAGMLGLGFITNFKAVPTEQKAALWQLSDNPQLNIARINEALQKGELNKFQAEERIQVIKDAEEAVKNTPKVNAQGKMMTDRERLDYFYNQLIQNKAKEEKKSQPKAQQEKIEYATLVADHTNNLIIDPKTPEELQARKEELENFLQEEDLQELPKLNAQAELEAINDYTIKKENEQKPSPTTDELLSGKEAEIETTPTEIAGFRVVGEETPVGGERVFKVVDEDGNERFLTADGKELRVAKATAEIPTKLTEPTEEQKLKDIKEGNFVTFTYGSEEEVPTQFKDKISSRGETNGKKFVRVTLPKSVADYELAKAQQEGTTPPTETTTEVTAPTLEEGATTELPPQVKGGLPRKMIFKDGIWQEQVGSQITGVSEKVQKQAQAEWESKNATLAQPKGQKTFTAQDIKDNPESLKEDQDYYTLGYPDSFVSLYTDRGTLETNGYKDSKQGDIVKIGKKDYVIESIEKSKNKETIKLLRVDKNGNILREKDLSKKEKEEKITTEEEPETQPETIEPKTTIEEPKNIDERKSLADKIRQFKTGGDKAFESILGIPVAIWDGSMELIAKSIEAGEFISDAIKKGIEYIKSNHKGKFDENEFFNKLKSELPQQKGEGEGKGVEGKVGEKVAVPTVKDFTKQIESTSSTIKTVTGDKAYNYINKDGVEVTLKEDEDGGYVNGNQVQADVHLDFIGNDTKRGEGLASKELDRIIAQADKNDMSISLVVDSDQAVRGTTSEKGLGDKELKKWYESKGFIFDKDSRFGYRPKSTEDASIYKKPEYIANKGEVTNDNVQYHSSPEDLQEAFDQGRLKEGTFHEDGTGDIYKLEDGKLKEVKNVKYVFVEDNKIVDKIKYSELPQQKGEEAKPTKPIEPKIEEERKTIADKIRKGKIGDDIAMGTLPFVKDVWNGAVEAMAVAVEISGDIAKGIKAGIEHIRNSDWYKNLSILDKQRAEKKFEDEFSHLLPKTPPKDYLDPTSEKRRVSGFMRHLMDATNVSEDTKKQFKENGIKYKVANNEEARRIASDIINVFGEQDALTMANTNDLHPSVRSAIFAESIDRAFMEEQNATNDIDRLEAARKWKDISIQYDKELTERGQFTAYAGHFYKTSPLGFVMKVAEQNEEIFNEWYFGKEKSYEELWNDLNATAEGQALVESEFNKIYEKTLEQKGREAADAEIQKLYEQLKPEKKKFVDKALDALDKLQQKIRKNTYSDFTGMTALIDAGITTIRAAIKAGVEISKAIERGVEEIKKEYEKATGKKWDKEDKFRKDMIEGFGAEGIETEKTKVDALQKRIEDLEKQIKDYKDKIAQGGVEGEKKEKKFSDNPTVQKLIEERDKLKKENEELLKEAKVGKYSDAEKIKASKKEAIENIKELERQLRENDLDIKNKTAPTDAELKAYREKQKELRKKIEEERKAQKIGKYSDAEKLKEAIKKRQEEIDEYNRRINDQEFSAQKKKTEKIITHLDDQLKEAKEKYEKLKKQSPEYKLQKAKELLDKYKSKLQGVSEEQAKEIISRASKKIIEAGGLDYEEFKKIIADVIGVKELTKEDIKNIQNLVDTVNAVEEAEQAMVNNPTQQNIAAYNQARRAGKLAMMQLGFLLRKKSDISQSTASIIRGALMSIFTEVRNIGQNIVYTPLRFSIAAFNQFGDSATYLASLGANKISGGAVKVYEPTRNIFLAQKGYFKKGKAGLADAWFNFNKGTQDKDIFGTSSYTSTISPFRAWKELNMWRKNQLLLTKKEVIDRLLRGTLGVQSDFILRGMAFGDKPPRWAAEGAEAIQIARYELKITDPSEIDAFMLSPQKMAYKILTERGMDADKALKISTEIQERIQRKGSEAVLEQENLLSEFSKTIDQKLSKSKEDNLIKRAGKSLGTIFKAFTFPFVKIPANAYWIAFKLNNPLVPFLQSALQARTAYDYSKKGEIGKSKEYIDKSKANLYFAGIGLGLSYAASGLVAQGYVRSSNDEDNKVRETTGERFYGKQNQFNWGRFRGGKDYWIDLNWLGPIGTQLNVQAQLADDRKKAELKGEKLYDNDLDGLMTNLQYSAIESLNNLVFNQGYEAIRALKQGKDASMRFFADKVNQVQNIFVGGTYVAISKATLPEEPRLKADTFAEMMANNIEQKNILVRLFSKYPPSKVSIWGDPIRQDNSFWGVVQNCLGFQQGSYDKFGAIIYNDFFRTQDARFFPAPEDIKLTIDGKEVKLKQEEKDYLDKCVGKARKELVDPFIMDSAVIPKDPYNEYLFAGKRYSEIKSDKDKILALNVLYDRGKKLGMELFVEKYQQYAPAMLTAAKEQEKEYETAVKETLQDIAERQALKSKEKIKSEIEKK